MSYEGFVLEPAQVQTVANALATVWGAQLDPCARREAESNNNRTLLWKEENTSLCSIRAHD
jgi:hypothetical protein